MENAKIEERVKRIFLTIQKPKSRSRKLQVTTSNN